MEEHVTKQFTRQARDFGVKFKKEAMRKIISVIALYILVSPLAIAKIQTANRIFESDMSNEECLAASRTARESIFVEKFGEISSDGMYDYLRDDIHFTVLCMPEKIRIVLFIAAQDMDVHGYITKFANVMEQIINKKEKELNQKSVVDAEDAQNN